MSQHSILVVDDDAPLLDAVGETLRREGYAVTVADSPEKALSLIEQSPFDLFVIDYKMPGTNGIELMGQLRRVQPGAEAIIITGYATIENGVEAIRKGARDYVTKPIEGYELIYRVQSVLEQRCLRASLKQKEEELKDKYEFSEIIGVSEAISNTREMGVKAGTVLSNVLIEGESGTGKELLARSIHYSSKRSKGPFVAVNCGAISRGIAESEFFGHRKGAFTGATMDSKGYFQAAIDGSLFLDEIGELPLDLQVKLLRALDNQEVTPVGCTEAVPINARMIFATNRNLEQMVDRGEFRHDLFYRINVIRIQLPPLRERTEDIPLLVSEFLRRSSKRLGIKAKAITEEAMAVLEGYEWAGNARELENVIERAIALGAGTQISLDDLPGWLLTGSTPQEQHGMGVGDFMTVRRQAQERFDREFILESLRLHDGNVSQTANSIGLARSALQRFMRKYGISRKSLGVLKSVL